MKQYISNEKIYEELLNIKKEIDSLKEDFLESNIGELSLYRASKWLKKSPEFLKTEVEEQRLDAEVKILKGVKRYRFRICDLYKWQKERFKHNTNVFIEPNEIFDPKRFIKNFHERNKAC